MNRRGVLKLGLVGAAVLAVAGGGLAWWRPGVRDGRLTPAARGVFAAVGRAVLEGSLPQDAAQRQHALDAFLQRLDATVAGLPAATRSELSDLLALISMAGGRWALAGLSVSWERASAREVQRALHSMRTSAIMLRQQSYHALRELCCAAYFVDASTWSHLGYPGPLAVP
jgi:hypothetical protein